MLLFREGNIFLYLKITVQKNEKKQKKHLNQPHLHFLGGGRGPVSPEDHLQKRWILPVTCWFWKLGQFIKIGKPNSSYYENLFPCP